MKLILCILGMLFVGEGKAFNNNYLLRSPEALLMGDAFTAVNDDAFTLFYNPATLGRQRRDFTLNPFNPQLQGTNILSDMNRFKNFPKTASGASKVLMDYPVHASAGIAPGFKLFNFGMTFIARESYDVLLRDRSNPMLDLDIHSDKGIMAGFAIPIGPGRISKKSQSGSQTSLGFGAKYLERTGLRDTVGLISPTVLGAIKQSEIDKIVKSMGQVKGIGYGFDMGVEHVVRSGNSQYVVGLSALDITGTKFKEGGQNPDKLEVADIKDQVNLGLAAGQDFKLFHYILSADVRGLNEQMELGQRLRIGGQVGIPGIKVMAGMNSGYYSYGAMLDIGFMRLTAGFYDMELGSRYKQVKSRRFVIYLSLFDFSFDS